MINVAEENTSQEFRPRNKEESNNYFIEEINQNELMGKKYSKTFATLNYIKHLPISVSAVTWCVSISAFDSLVGNSAVGLRIEKLVK